MPRWDALILAKAECGTVRSIGAITTREQIATIPTWTSLQRVYGHALTLAAWRAVPTVKFTSA